MPHTLDGCLASLRRLHRIVPLWALVVSSGCVMLQPLPVPPPEAPASPPPTLTFQADPVTDRSLAGSRLDLVYGIHNPAGEAVTVSGVQVAIRVDGKPVVEASPAIAALSVPPHGSAELHVPSEIHFSDLSLQSDATEAHYQARGTVEVQTRAGPVSVPFEHAGRLALPAKPGFSIGLPSVTSVAFPSALLAVPVRVRNPNDFPITLTGLSGDVSVLGSALGHVSNAERLVIAPGQEQTTRMSVEVPYLLLATSALARKIPEVGFQGYLETGPEQVPLSFHQTIPFQLQAPQVTLGMPRLDHVGFTSATLVFPFEVKNPNALPLPLGGIQGGLEVSGEQVGQVNTQDLGLIAAGQTTRVEVPLTVELLGAARSVLGGGPTSVGFHGQLHVASSTLPISFTQQLSFQR